MSFIGHAKVVVASYFAGRDLHPMTSRQFNRLALMAFASFVVCIGTALPVHAQFFGQVGAVGGVKVDAKGTIELAKREDLGAELARLRQQVEQPTGDMQQASELRVVSLKRLQKAMEAAAQSGDALPAEMQYMAGLQRVQYVFVDREAKDILLAGPAEAWTVRAGDAAVVGVKSGRAPVQLEDLLVAFRALDRAQGEGISCSIEPTPEGQRRLQAYLSRLPRNVQPGQVEGAMREAMGPQQIKLTGIGTDTHYAMVMVAADYQMKRIAMGLESSPVAGLPSYLEMAKNQDHAGNSDPRWWMACDYESLSHTADRQTWELKGRGVKTMTETDLVNADGTRSGSGKVEATAQKWADLMTANFEHLSREQPVFGQLRNVMDLTVVGALILSEGLDQESGCDLSTIMGRQGGIRPASYQVPESVPTQCSFIRGRKGWVVTASGGVSVDVMQALGKKQQRSLAVKPAAAPQEDNRWWWNG